MSWRKLWPEALILIVGTVLRFWDLDLKPPHFDEGINGWFVDQMFLKGFFQYDPSNYHGPLHFYLIQLSQLLFGFNIFGIRVVTVVFSIATLALLLRHRRYLGRAALWGAGAFAISPALIFYSRYSIHESELVFFLVLINYGILKWIFDKSIKAWVYVFVGAAGSMTTKETWVIHAAVFLIAWHLLPVLKKFIPEQTLVDEMTPTSRASHVDRPFLYALGASVFVFVAVLFSGFMHDPKGLSNFFLALIPWFKTGTVGNGHEKPWYYWIQVMWRYETILLVGFVICALGLRQTSRAIRWVGLVGAGTFTAYSIVAYKTPWCITSFLWAFCLVFGYAFENILRKGRVIRSLAIVMAMGLATYSLYRTIDLNFYSYDKEDEPYVYVSTFRELPSFYGGLTEMAKVKPSLMNSKIQVCLQSYWPLPWVMREFPNAVFSGRGCPTVLDHDVVLVDITDEPRLEPLLKGSFLRKKYRFRGSQEDFYAYYKAEVFRSFLPDAEVVKSGKRAP